MKIKAWKKVISYSFLALILIFTYLPIAVLVVYSFTDARSIGVWTGFTFELYAELFSDQEILSAILNSVILAVTSAGCATIIGTFAAVGIYSMKRIPRKLMEGTNQITMLNADIVTAIAFMLFFLIVQFIPFGWATLIISHTMVCIPYVVMSVLPRLSQLNPNLYEAGQDLGASPMRVMFTVMLPQLITAMLAGFMLSVTISLDDFVITKFNSNSEVVTISVYLYNKLKKGVKPVLRAMSTLILVVVTAVVVGINVGQKRRSDKVRKNV